MSKLNLRDIEKTFNIYPRTNKALAAWEIADIMRNDIDRRLVTAADGIRWTLETGRLSGTAEIAFRQMTTHNTLQILVTVANNCDTMSEVPSFLNTAYS